MACDSRPGRSRRVWDGLLVGATIAFLLWILRLVDAPAPALFAGLLGGLVHALFTETSFTVPWWGFRAAQGMLGVTIGSQASASALMQMADDALSIAAVTIGTILLGLGAGRLLALRPDISRVTGAFAMTAGGASGAIAMARELGADDQVVGVVQYLRVLVVLLLMPVVATVVFQPETGLGTLPDRDAGVGADLAFVGVSLVLGMLLAWRVPSPTAGLLGPLLVAAAVSTSGFLGPVGVPAGLQWLAFAAFGTHIGLRFTKASLASIGRMLPLICAVLLSLIAGSAAMGAVLATVTGVDPMTAYLATSPGGLFAVSVIAADTGGDVTYVVAVQMARLVTILAGAPLIARRLGRGGPH